MKTMASPFSATDAQYGSTAHVWESMTLKTPQISTCAINAIHDLSMYRRPSYINDSDKKQRVTIINPNEELDIIRRPNQITTPHH
jgi:hypothetical protein